MKNKNTFLLIGLVLVVLALLLGGYFYQRSLSPQLPEISQTTDADDAQRFAADYPQTPADNIFVYRTGPEIINILEHGTGVVYFGFKECGWCQASAPILNQVAQEAGLEKIYYFDVRQDRTDNTEVYQTIIALLGDHLDYDEEGRPRIFVPDITVVQNGQIVGHDNYTSQNTTDQDGTPAEFWTAERVTTYQQTLRALLAPLQSTDCGVGLCNL